MSIERHYPTDEACEILGLAHENDVRRLIKERKILARKRVVRGKGRRPRWVIPESALRRFLDGLETNMEAPAAPGPGGGDEGSQPPPRRGRGRPPGSGKDRQPAPAGKGKVQGWV